jgi:hypothetical protein
LIPLSLKGSLLSIQPEKPEKTSRNIKKHQESSRKLPVKILNARIDFISRPNYNMKRNKRDLLSGSLSGGFDHAGITGGRNIAPQSGALPERPGYRRRADSQSRGFAAGAGTLSGVAARA